MTVVETQIPLWKVSLTGMEAIASYREPRGAGWAHQQLPPRQLLVHASFTVTVPAQDRSSALAACPDVLAFMSAQELLACCTNVFTPFGPPPPYRHLVRLVLLDCDELRVADVRRLS